MKKFLSLFLALVYLATSSGLALQVHYCMDKVTGMSLLEDDDAACGKCGMKKASNPCCKDELKFLKLQDSHKLLTASYELTQPVAILHNVFPVQQQHLINIVAVTDFTCHSPPAALKDPLYILHSVFRI